MKRDGTVKPVSRDQIFSRERESGKKQLPCSAGHGQRIGGNHTAVDQFSAESAN